MSLFNFDNEEKSNSKLEDLLKQQAETLKRHEQRLSALEQQQQPIDVVPEIPQDASSLIITDIYEEPVADSEENQQEPKEEIKSDEAHADSQVEKPREDKPKEVNDNAPTPPKASNENSENEAMSSSLSEMKEEIKALTEEVEKASRLQNIINDMHEELQKLKKNFVLELKRDYINDIISIYEHIADTDTHFNPESNGDDVTRTKKNLQNNLHLITDLLEDQYSVEQFIPKPGDQFKPKEQKAIRTIETEDKEKANTVAECLVGGFRDITTGRIYKQARIVVYKLKQ